MNFFAGRENDVFGCRNVCVVLASDTDIQSNGLQSVVHIFSIVRHIHQNIYSNILRMSLLGYGYVLALYQRCAREESAETPPCLRKFGEIPAKPDPLPSHRAKYGEIF